MHTGRVEISVAIGAVVFGVLHLTGERLHFISYVPRSGWLSFAGGVSVAYVFVHLLPEVAQGERILAEELGTVAEAVWVVGLVGLTIFYWVESLTRRSRSHLGSERSSSPAAFWTSMAFYSAYNAIIAYLLHERAEEGVGSVALFVLALGLHFVVNDFSLREHHKVRYQRFGRWILVGSIAVGAGIGLVAEVSEVLLVTSVAFIGGGVILNVFKEELPSEAESRLTAFVAGAVLYTVILLSL